MLKRSLIWPLSLIIETVSVSPAMSMASDPNSRRDTTIAGWSRRPLLLTLEALPATT